MAKATIPNLRLAQSKNNFVYIPNYLVPKPLAYEFWLRNIAFQREVEMPVFYKDKQVGTRRVDFLIENCISTELKAITQLEDVHLAQSLNYLEAYNIEVGLLLNFGAIRLEYKRLLNKKYREDV